jgi:iron complex outermembrane receptor protein
VASLNQTVFKRVSVDLKMRLQDREGAFTLYRDGAPAEETPYAPFWLFDGKISWQRENLSLFVSVNNIFDNRYFDLGNVLQPGRWLKTGITYKIPFK